MRDYKNGNYFIKLPNCEETKTFVKVLRQKFKSPNYRVRVFPNGYKETLSNTKGWRIYIQEITHKTRSSIWYENLKVEEILPLRTEVTLLQERTTEGDLKALRFIRDKYPEILMEYLMTQGGE